MPAALKPKSKASGVETAHRHHGNGVERILRRSRHPAGSQHLRDQSAAGWPDHDSSPVGTAIDDLAAAQPVFNRAYSGNTGQIE
jgi:hypothetical protein